MEVSYDNLGVLFDDTADGFVLRLIGEFPHGIEEPVQDFIHPFRIDFIEYFFDVTQLESALFIKVISGKGVVELLLNQLVVRALDALDLSPCTKDIVSFGKSETRFLSDFLARESFGIGVGDVVRRRRHRALGGEQS